MIKNIKLMLVAVMAMLSMNSFAATVVGSTQYANGFKYVITSVDEATMTGEAKISKNTISEATKLTIPSQVEITVEGEDITGKVTFTVTAIAEEGFKGLEHLQEVVLPTTLEEIGASAFADCVSLKKVDFTGLTKLTTIGNYALGNTVITEQSFADCSKLTALPANLFMTTTVPSNAQLTKVVLPASPEQTPQLTNISTAFAKCSALAKIENLEKTGIITVTNLGFEDCAALTELTFPATLQTLTETPFKGCVKLATLNIPGSATTLGNGTSNLYGTGTDDVKALKTLNITGDVTASIAAGAFGEKVTTVNIAVGKKANGTNYAFTGSLAAGAITLDADANSTVTIGDIATGATFTADVIVGPTTNGCAATLTIGNVSVDLSNAILSNNISKATVGKITAALKLDVLGAAAQELVIGEIAAGGSVAYNTVNATLEKVTFTGNLVASAIAENAFNNCGKLATVDFGTIAMIANAVAAGAFEGIASSVPVPNANKATIIWKPAEATKAFNIKAFAGSSVGAASATFTLNTTDEVAELYNRDEGQLYNIIFSPATKTIKVAGNDGSVYWGKFKAVGSNYSIDKIGADKASVTVYSAYVDEADEIIYMDPLRRVDGQYVIEANQAVVIRSTSGSDIVATSTSDANTMRYDGSSQIVNDFEYTATIISAQIISSTYADKDIFVMANPATNGLYWQPLAAGQYIPKGGIYVMTNKVAAVRGLKVVFTDEAGTTDIIETKLAEKQAQNNAIYTLQGVRVNAPVKGQLYIKGGKKYIAR